MYRTQSPAQSSTSLSDIEDEDFNKSTFFPSEPVASTPAQWSRMQLVHSYPQSPRASLPSVASRLPPEILIHILKHIHSSRDLYHALLVSHAWCECSVELLWHRPNFSKLSTLGKMMRVLARDDQTFIYARFIRRLNFLYLGADLTDSLFSRLAQCVRLERLTLINCTSLSDGALTRVLPCCPNLVALDLTGVAETTDRAIVALASSTKRLQGINLSGCKKLSDQGVLALAANCPLLRRVKLSNVDQITDEAISALAKSCPLLLEIDLNNCNRITDVSVRDLWSYSNHMREMRLSHCPELTDAAFPASPRSEGASAEGVNPFPSSSFTPDKLPPLRLPRSFEHLRMLDLTGCSHLTDETVEGIIAVAPKIRNLVLAKCVQITDAAVEAICGLGKHLHYLHLGHASNITDRSIRSLARACTRLRYIDLANCLQLTDMSVFELASLQKLRRIGLVRVSNLTDHAIHSLGERHATLERIHLSYCDQITVTAIHFLLQKLPKLTHLSLTGIPAFRRQELQQFCREPPQEFNPGQRAAFCVYSGKGVQELRDFLSELFNTITDDLAVGSGTEYDDEYEEDHRRYIIDDMQVVNEGDDEPEEDDIPHDRPRLNGPIQRPHPQNYTNVATTIPAQTMPREQRGHVHQQRTTANPLSRTHGQPSVRNHLHSADTRRNRGFGQHPIVEAPTSPVPSEAASNRSAGTSSNGASWFRNYVETNGGSLRQGVPTPDLVFAEIGHGRGAGVGAHAGPASALLPTTITQPRRTSDTSHVPPLYGRGIFTESVPPVVLSGFTTSRTDGLSRPQQISYQFVPHDRIVQVVDAPNPSGPSGIDCDTQERFGEEQDLSTLTAANSFHRSSASDTSHSWTPAPRDPIVLDPQMAQDLQATTSATFGGHPTYSNDRSATDTRDIDPARGRSARRGLKNTLSAAEQYASSFLFGRGSSSSGHEAPSLGGPSSGSSRDGDTRGH